MKWASEEALVIYVGEINSPDYQLICDQYPMYQLATDFEQLPETLMGIWTALSQCEMVQAAFVWPQRWSNTDPDQTAGKGMPKLQE